jgi:hypothetical protein
VVTKIQTTAGGTMKKIVLFGLLGGFLCGCTTKHLVYVHDTSIGIDVAASTEGTGRLMFGYDRDTYAIVPRKQGDGDAMTLVSMSCVYAKGISKVNFNHFVSSGKAAKNIAKSEEGLTAIKNALYGGGEQCNQ